MSNRKAVFVDDWLDSHESDIRLLRRAVPTSLSLRHVQATVLRLPQTGRGRP